MTLKKSSQISFKQIDSVEFTKSLSKFNVLLTYLFCNLIDPAWRLMHCGSYYSLYCVVIQLYVHSKCFITELLCYHFILKNVRAGYFPSTYLYPCFSGRTPAEQNTTCGTCVTSYVAWFSPRFSWRLVRPPSPSLPRPPNTCNKY